MCGLLDAPQQAWPLYVQAHQSYISTHLFQLWACSAFFMIPIYVLSVPITTYLTRPAGAFTSTILPSTFATANTLLAHGAFEDDPESILTLLALGHTFMTYIVSGVFSVAGQTMGSPHGYQNSGISFVGSVPRGAPTHIIYLAPRATRYN